MSKNYEESDKDKSDSQNDAGSEDEDGEEMLDEESEIEVESENQEEIFEEGEEEVVDVCPVATAASLALGGCCMTMP